MPFFRAPSRNAYSIDRIGGAKATEEYYIILGNAPDEILEFMEVPTEVAIAWRDATVDLLSTHRPHRPLRQIDWSGLAVSADPKWAADQGWITPPAPQAPAAAPVSPVRPILSGAAAAK
jgi:hypothetical protein